MAVTEKTVFICYDGRQFDKREDAERAEAQQHIADALLELVRTEEDEPVLTPVLADHLAWFSKDILAILKRHLAPEQPVGIERPEPITKQEARDLLSGLGFDAMGVGVAIEERAQVMAILEQVR
jgi:predicted outer membrane protein